MATNVLKKIDFVANSDRFFQLHNLLFIFFSHLKRFNCTITYTPLNRKIQINPHKTISAKKYYVHYNIISNKRKIKCLNILQIKNNVCGGGGKGRAALLVIKLTFAIVTERKRTSYNNPCLLLHILIYANVTEILSNWYPGDILTSIKYFELFLLYLSERARVRLFVTFRSYILFTLALVPARQLPYIYRLYIKHKISSYSHFGEVNFFNILQSHFRMFCAHIWI